MVWPLIASYHTGQRSNNLSLTLNTNLDPLISTRISSLKPHDLLIKIRDRVGLLRRLTHGDCCTAMTFRALRDFLKGKGALTF